MLAVFCKKATRWSDKQFRSYQEVDEDSFAKRRKTAIANSVFNSKHSTKKSNDLELHYVTHELCPKAATESDYQDVDDDSFANRRKITIANLVLNPNHSTKKSNDLELHYVTHELCPKAATKSEYQVGGESFAKRRKTTIANSVLDPKFSTKNSIKRDVRRGSKQFNSDRNQEIKCLFNKYEWRLVTNENWAPKKHLGI
ncbi:hypothetical protein AMTR_s00002p00270270 [Amborella trichopoda]|uniref:Uncharacterized protein n=1 Tax=Amborella trichopoda TaxID=13333 RepID=W1P1H4_AMBTC|nr:hypothetical protein AMTR_s00002p00270270 [Amborella trichopoda]